MKKLPVSLQLWSLNREVTADFAGTVGEVARIGYAGVELAGYGNLTPAEAAKAVAAAGLKTSGSHVGMPALRADLGKVIDEAFLFETKHIICPWFPGHLLKTRAAVESLGGELNEIGEYLRTYGLDFHYHNHAEELAIVEGRTVFDWLLDAAEPRNLGAEADVYWLHAGGKDPAAFIREQGRRIRLLHLKDETELGRGPVNFNEVFEAADAVGAVEWYVVEQERSSDTPMESVKYNLEQLRKWGVA